MTFGPAENITDGGDAADVFKPLREQTEMQQFDMVDDLAVNYSRLLWYIASFE